MADDSLEAAARSMTPDTLALRINELSENIRSVSKAERDALLGEATMHELEDQMRREADA